MEVDNINLYHSPHYFGIMSKLIGNIIQLVCWNQACVGLKQDPYYMGMFVRAYRKVLWLSMLCSEIYEQLYFCEVCSSFLICFYDLYHPVHLSGHPFVLEMSEIIFSFSATTGKPFRRNGTPQGHYLHWTMNRIHWPTVLFTGMCCFQDDPSLLGSCTSLGLLFNGP